MKFKIFITPEAEVDILESKYWYEQKLSRLGSQFITKIDNKISTIRESPRQFPIVKSSIRRALINKFPFAIFFVIKENTIIILAVSHVKRNPRTWINRTF